MPETVRWAVEMDESLLRALELRAARQGEPATAVAESLLRRALAAEIEELAGEVPLAAMIQQVVHRGSRTRCRTPQSAPA